LEDSEAALDDDSAALDDDSAALDDDSAAFWLHSCSWLLKPGNPAPPAHCRGLRRGGGVIMDS
jgi:hypothetical protein